MTAPEDGLEEALRQALHAALNQVEPGADGLERIRARTSGRKPRPWLLSVADGTVDRVRHWTWRGHWGWSGLFPRLGSVPRPRLRFLPQGPAHVPAHAATTPRPRPAGVAWLRPAAVLAGVVFLASVALAIPPFRQAIVQVSNTVLTGGQAPGGTGGSGGGSVAGTGTLPGSATRAGGASGSTGAFPGAAGTTRCQPTAVPSPAPSQFVSAVNSSGTTTIAAGESGNAGVTGPSAVLPPLATHSPTACPTASSKVAVSPVHSPSPSPSLSPSPVISVASPSTSPSATSTSPTQGPTASQSPSQSPSPTVTPSLSTSSSPAATPSGS